MCGDSELDNINSPDQAWSEYPVADSSFQSPIPADTHNIIIIYSLYKYLEGMPYWVCRAFVVIVNIQREATCADTIIMCPKHISPSVLLLVHALPTRWECTPSYRPTKPAQNHNEVQVPTADAISATSFHIEHTSPLRTNCHRLSTYHGLWEDYTPYIA